PDGPGDVVDGGAGIDTLIVDASAETDTVALFSGAAPTFEVRSASGNFYVDAYNMEPVKFTGGSANDTIDTANHGGTVNGGAGSDTLVVNASAETDGVQLYSGAAPTFEVRSNSGNFYVDAYNMETVKFTGGSANDTIDTGNHGGTVNGGAGVDTWTA